MEVLHQIEHRLDHSRKDEDLPMVGDALFGLDVVHGAMINSPAAGTQNEA